MVENNSLAGDTAPGELLVAQLDNAITHLAQTDPLAKAGVCSSVLDIVGELLRRPDLIEEVYLRIASLEESGIFAGSDWAHPEVLQPLLAANSLRLGERAIVTLECLSQLRFLAVAQGIYFHPVITSERARHFLAQVLALNLNLLFGTADEAERLRDVQTTEIVHTLYRFLVEHVGYENILDQVIDEAWRILSQRPIQVDTVKTVVTQIAVWMANPDMASSARGGDRLVSALFGPTHGCREDPGLQPYAERLAGMDESALQQEAGGFARAMHDTGLVSSYHSVFMRHVLGERSDLLATALGLSSTGREVMLCYQSLVEALVKHAVYPETAQCIYGLALMLERGILYQPPIAPALWRQIALPLSGNSARLLSRVFGEQLPPNVFLLAGVLNTLGQPLGVGQGNNPTCQSARAISMWAYNDPDYLLQMVAWAARDDEVLMHFEGESLSSGESAPGLATAGVLDVDPVSLVLVPHLDRIYMAMGRLCQGRPDDPHRWINPEFHGWWVGRGCRLAVSLATGALDDYENFLRHFYASYHPFYNGNQPVIHPQPAGMAVTDSMARFVGWHAITLLRVGLDQEGTMRAYFYNPNNDSGQDWGEGVVVSTGGYGERFGESSLPVAQFASRLYLFHFDPLEPGDPAGVPLEDLEAIIHMARSSWAVNR